MMISRRVRLANVEAWVFVHDGERASISFLARELAVTAGSHLASLDELERVRDAINAVLVEARS
jgi:hypothetical protein